MQRRVTTIHLEMTSGSPRGAIGDGMAMRPGRLTLALLVSLVLAPRVQAPFSFPAAVPAVLVADAASADEGGELPRKGYLGVRLAPLPDEVRARERLGAGVGVLIEAVLPGTAAESAGIRQGDVLLAVDGQDTQSIPGVMATIAAMTAGRTFEVTLRRVGRQVTLPVTLGERPRDRGETFEVLYGHVRSGGARIRTIITRPHEPGRHPVLFLIQGNGPTTIDQPLSSPEPYSRILNAFARSGYVTVRVEKPGIGDSEGGPFTDLDFETELDAYRQALTAVRTHGFVDPGSIFIFGHSMGGVFAPILASELPATGVAVHGTVAKTLMEYFLENWRRQARLAGDDPALIDAMLRDLAAALNALLVEHRSPDQILRTRPELRSILAKLAPAGRIDGRSMRFWSQLATRNLPAYWAKGDAAVLAIWGRNDFIATEADHPFIADIVNRARPGQGTSRVLEGSDHGFRQTASAQDSFTRWKSPRGEFNPDIITALKEWMEKVRTGRCNDS